MNKTGIEWTDYSWNPIHARRKNGGKTGNFCTRISPGCLHCYASKINQRWGNGLEYIVPNLANVEFYLDEKELRAPIKLKPGKDRPQRIFVGDMFDLFHEAIPDQFIKDVLLIAMGTPHIFQFLTKRAERMRKIMSAGLTLHVDGILPGEPNRDISLEWPPSNFHMGVSVEDQQRADERIPLLLQTPAAVRWLSVEPMLEAIDLCGKDPQESAIDRYAEIHDGVTYNDPKIDWVVCGGESGPGARPFNLEWAESLLDQCRAAGVPFFMKQVGSQPVATCKDPTLPDVPMGYAKGPNSKGGTPEYWPEKLRIREFPAERTVTA